jgi:hypothetical protein
MVLLSISIPGEHIASGAPWKGAFFCDDNGVLPVPVLKVEAHTISTFVCSMAERYRAIGDVAVDEGYVVGARGGGHDVQQSGSFCRSFVGFMLGQ